jgi:N-methylhydantoinase A
VRTWFKPVNKLKFEELEQMFSDMEGEGRSMLQKSVKQSQIACTRAADMRYVGQEHSVTVELPASVFKKKDPAALKEHFDREHMKRYEFNAPKEPAEIVSLHSSIIGRMPKPASKALGKAKAAAKKPARRKVYFTEATGYVDTPVYARSALVAGQRIKGPALVEEYASTTVIFQGDSLEVSKFGDLVIKIARS